MHQGNGAEIHPKKKIKYVCTTEKTKDAIRQLLLLEKNLI